MTETQPTPDWIMRAASMVDRLRQLDGARIDAQRNVDMYEDQIAKLRRDAKQELGLDL